MKVYFKQEKLRFARKSGLSLRFVYKEYIFRIFTLIEIPHKKFNRVKYLLKNYKKLKFTLDVFGYEEFNEYDSTNKLIRSESRYANGIVEIDHYKSND